MGATLLMVVTLAVVLGLMLLLLAQLYCSLLLRQMRNSTTHTTTTTTTANIASSPSQQHSSSQFTTIYSQGVLQPPPTFLGLVSSPSSLQSFMSRAPSKQCNGGEHLVYISNPIYENEEGKKSEQNTPFETPDTSPSHLERNGSSSDDDDGVVEESHCGVQTLPSTIPMKKLHGHEEACSLSLTDARSLGTSRSDSHSNNVLSSSSSSSLSTSPSW
ncbi:hypothetical protein Lal_00002907 [Lupinus albus]|nr:hypothetical protein Lal_00002907 [Lupinus albus]